MAKKAVAHKPHGDFLAAEGLAFRILGVAAIIMPFLYDINIAGLIGWLFIAGGIFKLVRSWRIESSMGYVLRVISTLVYLGAGIWIVADSSLANVTLITILSAVFGIHAILGVGQMVLWRDEDVWALPLIGALVNAVLAGVVWVGYPGRTAWFLGLMVGLHFLAYGIARMIFAIIRRA